MKCKYCAKEFHSCSSCGLDGFSEYGYCSETCFENSTEVMDLLHFIDRMPSYKSSELLCILNNISSKRTIDIVLHKLQKFVL